jgi:hypothetical protein
LSAQQLADRKAMVNHVAPKQKYDKYGVEGKGTVVCESMIAELSEPECNSIICCKHSNGKCHSTVGDAECSTAEKDLPPPPRQSHTSADESADEAPDSEDSEEEVGDAEKSIRTMEAELNSAHDAKDLENVLDQSEKAESDLQSADREQFASSVEQKQLRSSSQPKASSVQNNVAQPGGSGFLLYGGIVILGVGMYMHFKPGDDETRQKYTPVGSGGYQVGDPSF